MSTPPPLHKEPSPDLLPVGRGPTERNYCCLYFLNETGSIAKDPEKHQFKMSGIFYQKFETIS